MSEQPDSGQPTPRGADEVHQYTVDHVRDVTREGKIVIEAFPSKGQDTAFRQLFPTTYDLVLDHPEAKETAEDK